MFFDNISQISTIATKTSCSIFVVPPDTKLQLKTPLYLRPDDTKTTSIISVEQLRDFLALTSSRETSDRFFVITPADAMNEAAQNAFLKTFEEPKDFVILSYSLYNPTYSYPPSARAHKLFYLKTKNSLDQPPQAKDKIMSSAKRLISATPLDLPAIAADLTKNKTQPRAQALEIVGLAIELLYKSYFKTGNTKFLTKLPNFLHLYESIEQNGHIKLHFVADLC